jgi:FdrA protein
MSIQVVIRSNAYYDSVTLMQISKKIEGIAGIQRAMVSMGTDMNKELLANAGLMTDEVQNATPSDLVIAFLADRDDLFDEVLQKIDEALAKKAVSGGESVVPPASIESAVKREPGSNIAVISLPGQYAAAEAMKALRRGLHVMLFSDNVSVEEEVMLKKFAHEHGLLVMGPDCGTAIINNKGLCFANAVRAGSIGVVGASGTGTQEVTVLIDRFGGGVSQVIGTGGRDLSEAVGGIMMCDGLQALNEDPNTSVIVLVSKPPVQSVAEKVLALAKTCAKPVVVCFINSEKTGAEDPVIFAETLEDAARKAVELSGTPVSPAELAMSPAAREALDRFYEKRTEQQKYVRGLFCGGTLCDEAMFLFKKASGEPVYSNVAKADDERLEAPEVSRGHTFVDLGDDRFTVGRPHPMIDPSLRNSRILQEANDEETAVILLDVELGYGSHEDPAGVVAEAVRTARKMAALQDRELCFVAYVCGTPADYQNYTAQVVRLEEEGVLLAPSNATAARLAAKIVKGERV